MWRVGGFFDYQFRAAGRRTPAALMRGRSNNADSRGAHDGWAWNGSAGVFLWFRVHVNLVLDSLLFVFAGRLSPLGFGF